MFTSRLTWAAYIVGICMLSVVSLSASAQNRIIDGIDTPSGQYPWMAAIVSADSDAFLGQFCGGSLIAPNWVITAAHCVENTLPDDLEVILDRVDLDALDGERIGVKRIIGHPDWFEILSHDLALLELSESSTVTPIEIAPADSGLVRPGRFATVMGWGLTAFSYPTVLKQVDLPIVSHNFCQTNYAQIDLQVVEDLHICAGYVSGGRNACFGDSGGPLIMNDPTTGRLVLIGVVSFGAGCGAPDFPEVYSRISNQIDWIERQVNGTATLAESSDLNPHFARIDHACFGLSCMVDGRRSYDALSPVVNYEWDMGDGTTLYGPVVRHLYSQAGSDSVILTATRADGTTDKVFKRVSYDASLRNDFKRVTRLYRGNFSSGEYNDQIIPKKRPDTGIWLFAGAVVASVSTDAATDLAIALEQYNETSAGWEVVATGDSNQALEHKAVSGYHRLIVSHINGTGDWTLSLNARRTVSN